MINTHKKEERKGLKRSPIRADDRTQRRREVRKSEEYGFLQGLLKRNIFPKPIDPVSPVPMAL